MRKIIPIIKTDDCLKALNYYCDIFNAKINSTVLNSSDCKNIEIAEIIIDDNFIISLEKSAGTATNYNENTSLILGFDSQDELRTIYKKLAIDGFVLCPLQKTLKGTQHGVVKDLFGVTWRLEFSV